MSPGRPAPVRRSREPGLVAARTSRCSYRSAHRLRVRVADRPRCLRGSAGVPQTVVAAWPEPFRAARTAGCPCRRPTRLHIAIWYARRYLAGVLPTPRTVRGRLDLHRLVLEDQRGAPIRGPPARLVSLDSCWSGSWCHPLNKAKSRQPQALHARLAPRIRSATVKTWVAPVVSHASWGTGPDQERLLVVEWSCPALSPGTLGSERSYVPAARGRRTVYLVAVAAVAALALRPLCWRRRWEHQVRFSEICGAQRGGQSRSRYFARSSLRAVVHHPRSRRLCAAGA